MRTLSRRTKLPFTWGTPNEPISLSDNNANSAYIEALLNVFPGIWYQLAGDMDGSHWVFGIRGRENVYFAWALILGVHGEKDTYTASDMLVWRGLAVAICHFA